MFKKLTLLRYTYMIITAIEAANFVSLIIHVAQFLKHRYVYF